MFDFDTRKDSRSLASRISTNIALSQKEYVA